MIFVEREDLVELFFDGIGGGINFLFGGGILIVVLLVEVVFVLFMIVLVVFVFKLMFNVFFVIKFFLFFCLIYEVN